MRLDIPFDPEDVHLDYLVAHHIVAYREVPLSGSGNPLLIDSPLYYYIVSLFVRIWDSLLFLGIVNIVLVQGLTFWLLYRLALRLFDEKTAIITLLLAVTSQEYFKQGAFFFQTHVLQVVVYAGWYALVRAHKGDGRIYAYSSAVLAGFSVAIHHSALAMLPVYMIFLFRLAPWYKVFALFSSVVVLSYIPVFGLLYTHPEIVAGMSVGGFVSSAGEYGSKFFSNLHQIVFSFFDGENWFSYVLIGLLAWGFVVGRKAAKKTMGVIVCIVLQYVLLASLLRTGVWNFTFSSTFGLLLIVVALCIRSLWQWRREAGIAILILAVFVFSRVGQTPRQKEQFLYRYNLTHESAEAIIREIPQESSFRIHRVHKKPTRGFFVNVYTPQGIQVLEDLLYWPILEKRLGRQFVQISQNGAVPTIRNTDEYVFVVCDSTREQFTSNNECVRKYLLLYPRYRFVRNVYAKEPLSIVLVYTL